MCGIEQAHIVTATGSGGTQTGLTLGAELHQLPATVWGINVCDDEAYFLNKVASDAADWRRRYPEAPEVAIEPRVLDGYVGPGYAIAEPEIFQLIAELGRLEGLVSRSGIHWQGFRRHAGGNRQWAICRTRGILYLSILAVFSAYFRSVVVSASRLPRRHKRT